MRQVIFDYLKSFDIEKYVPNKLFQSYIPKNDPLFENLTEYNKPIEMKFLEHYINKCDLLVGGVPCQSFSSIGLRKGLDDKRGNLIFKFIDVISILKPKVFMIENVKGLLTINKGSVFKLIIEKINELMEKITKRTHIPMDPHVVEDPVREVKIEEPDDDDREIIYKGRDDWLNQFDGYENPFFGNNMVTSTGSAVQFGLEQNQKSVDLDKMAKQMFG